ncbi:hypothetical protein AYO45_04815 [Gammaproteobacteria bacterium SCGC AG-212-F23]|nr:hypothetical protein AYO45_04815 [Gammaproteobacteria bacterium SCGC AG-212-F23]
MTTYLINTLDAKEQFADLINRVVHNKERVILTRRGKEVAALIPFEDLEVLRTSQDKNDLQEAIQTLKEARDTGTVSLQQLKDDTHK